MVAHHAFPTQEIDHAREPPTSPPPPTHHALTLIALVGAGCSSDYVIVPSYPVFSEGDASCIADTQSWWKAPRNTDSQGGVSASILSTGEAPGDENLYRWQATGAPGLELDDQPGFVRVSHADTATGLLDPAAGHDATLRPSGVGAFYQLGWSVLAADVRECHPGSAAGKYDGCGQELLVGAPDTGTGSTGGRVFWWKADGDDNDPRLQYGGRITPPTGASPTGQFGYALAAAVRPADPNAPWDIAGTYPRWVAISAPGEDLVYLYNVTPSSTHPLGAPVQTLRAPIVGRGFGTSLAVGDFDGDAVDDLAIGAPYDNGTDGRGLVWVYRGTDPTSYTIPVYDFPLVLDGLELTGGSTFARTYHGWSMAAGRISAEYADRDLLVVGAPMYGTDEDGGVCQYVLEEDTGSWSLSLRKADSPDCWENGFNSATLYSSTFEHAGFAVAVGNFHNADSTGDDTSPEARHPEVAIARPGYLAGEGAVNLFTTDRFGADFASFWTEIREYTGPAPGARFGESLGRGYVQPTHWEDLVIGAPEHTWGGYLDGTASLTKAVANSASTDISAYWNATDAHGDLRHVKAWSQDTPTSETHLLLLTKYWYGLYEDYGGPDQRLCTRWDEEDEEWKDAFFFAKGTEFVLPGAWTPGAPSMTWNDADMSALAVAMTGMDVELLVDVVATLGTSPDTLTVVLSDPQITWGVSWSWEAVLEYLEVDDPENCELSPFVLENPSWGVCE